MNWQANVRSLGTPPSGWVEVPPPRCRTCAAYSKKKGRHVCRPKVILLRTYGWLGFEKVTLPILVFQFPMELEYMPENHMDPFEASNEVPV